MVDRVTKVTLTADVKSYISGMEAAARGTNKVQTEAEKLKAKDEAFKTIGRTAVVVGTAVTAIGIAAAKTGIEYNSLQQKSRAALKSLLGSAEAANAQMDKLDAFARNSPFSKATFITAQQQMLAFGIEAKKVVPYLDAIQNAVAAAGGSNADIAGIVATMSKIQSSAKITAEDLNELGNRGVNAAELIGSQMGLTGAQIREQITAGSLDAGAALDALAAGMSDRFAGAADNVKQTWEGATDRLSAAWRDFSAELAKPLIDPNGGGALVDLANWASDMLRGFEALPGPVKTATTTLTLAGGAVTLLGGAAILAVPKLVAAKVAVEALGISAGTTGKAMAGLKTGMTVLAAVGVGAWATQVTGGFIASQREAMGLKDTVDSLADSFDALGAKATVDKVVGDKLGASTDAGFFSDILTSAEKNVAGLEDFSLMLQALGVEGQLTSSKLATLDKTMADMASSGNAEGAAELYDELASRTNGSSDALDKLNALLPEYTSAQGDAGSATSDASGEMESFATSTEDAQAAADAFVESLRGLGDTQLSLNEANRQVQASLDEFTAKIAENGQTLDITTEAGRANQSALDGIAQSYIAAAAAAVEHTNEEAAAIPVIEAGRQAIINAGIAAGLSADEAAAYADELGLIPKNVKTTIDANFAAAIAEAHRMAQAIRDIPGYKAVVIDQQIQQTGAARGAVGAAYDNYKGNLYAYAGGGFAPGIYAGRAGAIHKFAEPETRWEAYVSGKPGMEERNRQIVWEAGDRLGMWGGGGQAAAAPMSLEGVSITGRLEIGGDGLATIVDGRIRTYDKAASRTQTHGTRL